MVGGGTAAWWGFPPSAFAAGHDCGIYTGNQGRYHTTAANNVGMQGTSAGVKAGGAVGSGTGDFVFGGASTTCTMVASVWDVAAGGATFVEVGWHIQNGDQQDSQCGPSIDPPQAIVFYFYSINNTYSCHEYGDTNTLSAGYFYPVSVRFLSGTKWQVIFNGTTLAITPDLHFNMGYGVTNAERVHVDLPPDEQVEPAWGHFTQMKYWTGSAWTAWGSHNCWYGPNTGHAAYEDPAYHNQFPSNSNTEVISTALTVPSSEDCPNPAP